MPTPKTSEIEIINVTTDVRDAETAYTHYFEEEKARAFRPILRLRQEKVKGKTVWVYNICRIPNGMKDTTFVRDQWAAIDKRKQSFPYVSMAKRYELMVYRSEDGGGWVLFEGIL